MLDVPWAVYPLIAVGLALIVVLPEGHQGRPRAAGVHRRR